MIDKIQIITSAVAIIALIATITVSIISYHKRHNIDNEFRFSDPVVAGINSDMSRVNNLVGVIIVSADIQTNSQKVVFLKINDSVLDAMFTNYFKYKSITQFAPLFTKDNDEINQRMVKLINHEFVCAPWSSTVGSRFIPDAEQKIKMTCAVGVPPSYGGFDGTINILLSKDPTEDEKVKILAILRETANDIAYELAKSH